jgi:hypothetical protein
MTITLGEQQIGQRHALTRRAKARFAHPLIDARTVLAIRRNHQPAKLRLYASRTDDPHGFNSAG